MARSDTGTGVRKLDDAACRVLRGGNFGVLATLMADGRPQTTTVWVGTDGEHIMFATTTAALKYRNIIRDARVALTVTDRFDPYLEVNVMGRVSDIEEVNGVEYINHLSERYLGLSRYPYLRTADRWVKIVIDVDRVRTNLAPRTANESFYAEGSANATNEAR